VFGDKLYLWFMRIATIPVIAGSVYMVIDSYHRIFIEVPLCDTTTLSHIMLTIIVGIIGGTFSLAYFLVAWATGWKKK
jgi:H+/Cl- antiporter ClcA